MEQAFFDYQAMRVLGGLSMIVTAATGLTMFTKTQYPGYSLGTLALNLFLRFANMAAGNVKGTRTADD